MRTDDGYIIQKCFDGDSTAFGLIVDKYKKSIYALAYSRIHNFHDAQDITQEVFVKAYRDLRTLRRWDSFMGWLYRITINLCKNWQRSESRRPDREFTEDQDQIILDSSSISHYQQDKVYESIQEALESLPEMYHEVLVLHYFDGMNIKDMARFLGISPRTIDRRLSEARIELKKEMIAMMNTAYKQHGLPANFTFRLVEMVKHIRIHPISKIGGVPWGLSLATGIIIAVLGLGSHPNLINSLSSLLNSSSIGKSSVIKTGEIPVNVIDISKIPILASDQGNGNARNIQNAFFMAPQGEGDTWSKKTDMPTARGAMPASMVNGKIYVIGGWGSGYFNMAVVEAYDPATDTWERKSDMPTQRGGLSACVVDGIIYAIGGGSGPMLSTVEAYDPKTDTWTKKADMPTPRAMGPSSCVVDGIIYVMGGGTSPTALTRAVEAYDPKTDTWTKKKDMPESGGLMSTSVVGGIIYAIGGGYSNVSGLSAVLAYDPKTDTWTKKADMPTARMGLSTCVANGIIYAIGGVSVGGGWGLSTVEAYDPAKDTWTTKANMPTARRYPAGCAVNGKIYIIGGQQGSNYITTVEEYDTGFIPTTPVTNFDKKKLTTTWSKIKSY
jgi:RNA polymerase sigma factor (sigma-70 family)